VSCGADFSSGLVDLGLTTLASAVDEAMAEAEGRAASSRGLRMRKLLSEHVGDDDDDGQPDFVQVLADAAQAHVRLPVVAQDREPLEPPSSPPNGSPEAHVSPSLVSSKQRGVGTAMLAAVPQKMTASVSLFRGPGSRPRKQLQEIGGTARPSVTTVAAVRVANRQKNAQVAASRQKRHADVQRMEALKVRMLRWPTLVIKHESITISHLHFSGY
jgi:hypothetical protein